MKEIISVIIPIYNMEKYLTRCLDSVINETYKNLEILLINDGSTDNSEKICLEYAEKDKRIKYFYKENGGQGSARNMGLDIATGDYIAFVDSDDFIELDMYEILMNNIKQYDADISCCDGICSFDRVSHDKKIREFNNNEIMREHLNNNKGTGHSPCDKLYRSVIFNDIRFPKMRAFEDCATIYKVFAKAQKVVYQNVELYHYIERESSTMTQHFSKVKFQQIDAYYGMYKFYLDKYNEYANLVKRFLVGSMQYCLGEAYLDDKNKYEQELKELKEKLLETGGKGLSFKHKLSRILILRLPKIYAKIYKKKRGNING